MRQLVWQSLYSFRVGYFPVVKAERLCFTLNINLTQLLSLAGTSMIPHVCTIRFLWASRQKRAASCLRLLHAQIGTQLMFANVAKF